MTGLPLRSSVLVASVVLLGGCLHVPEPEPPPAPVELPGSWVGTVSPEVAAPEPGPWWERLRSPELSVAVERALSDSPEIEAIAARIGAAEARARIAGSDLFPGISARFDAARRRQNFIGFPIPGAEDRVLSTTTTTVGSTFGLSWELDLWGRIRAGRSAAEADLRATVAEGVAGRLSLTGQVAKAWLAWRESLGQVRLAEAALEIRRETLETARRRHRAGLVPAAALRRSRAAVASSRAGLAARRQAVEAASRRLEILQGGYPDGSPLNGPPEGISTGGLLPPPPDPVPAGIPADLLDRRPDLLAARGRMTAAEYRIHEAEAARWPSLRLTGSGGRTSEEVEELLDSDFTVWSLAGSLLAPIVQGGRLEAGVELAEARRREAVAGWARTVLRALSEVETALAVEEELRLRLEFLEEVVAEARASADLAARRHLSGVGGYLARLEAEEALVDARSRRLEARRARLENRVDLHLALGGDFVDAERREDPSVAPPSDAADSGGTDR